MTEIEWSEQQDPDDFTPKDMHVLTLPTHGAIIELWLDAGDLMARTDLGEVYRIDTEKNAIRPN